MGKLSQALLYFWNFRYLSIKYRWPLIKLRRRLLPTKTGLGLRNTFRHAHSLKHPPQPSPFFFVLRLLWPFPSWHFPAVLPSLPWSIVDEPEKVRCQERDLMYLRSMPLWKARDTPHRAFYRLYEAFCAASGYMITYETEYFWRHASPEWATISIPDLQCDDPEQQAVMASLAELLTESFIWRLEIGLRRNGVNEGIDGAPPTTSILELYPPWTVEVPSLETKLIPDPDDEFYIDSPLHKRNIIASTGFFYTV